MRHFTRAEVEAFVLDMHPKAYEGEVIVIKQISLMYEIDVPLWHVEMDRGIPGHLCEVSDLITEIPVVGTGEYQLYPLVEREIPIPDGLETVAEEDKAIKDAERSMHEQWTKKRVVE